MSSAPVHTTETDKHPIIPPVLSLPSTGASSKWGAEVELRHMRDGRVALLA